jgi:hypothetical protein
MQGARYMRLIPWTLHSGSEHLVQDKNFHSQKANYLKYLHKIFAKNSL